MKPKLPVVGGLYVFYWPKRKPSMRACGRVLSVKKAEDGGDFNDVEIDMGEKGTHRIILDQARFEVAHPDEMLGIFMK